MIKSFSQFRKAVEYLDDKQIEDDMEVPIDRFLLPKDLQLMLEERVKTLNNMTQAQMKLSAWDSALSSARQVSTNHESTNLQSKIYTALSSYSSWTFTYHHQSVFCECPSLCTHIFHF